MKISNKKKILVDKYGNELQMADMKENDQDMDLTSDTKKLDQPPMYQEEAQEPEHKTYTPPMEVNEETQNLKKKFRIFKK